jgi:hypothetical protein
MKADNTIITEAEKDGRASKPWFQCSGKYGVGVTTANTHRVGKVPKVPKTRIIINLRKGESIKRIWGNEGKSWFPKGEKRWTQPKHGCTRQHTDANDPVNWPYWKPYAEIRKKTDTKILYGVKRYFGNGRMTYSPNIASKEFLAGVSKENIQAKKSLQPQEAGKPASISFDITCPYIMVDAWLDLQGLKKTNDDVLAVYAKGAKGEWQEVFRAAQTGEVKQENISLKKAAWASKKYSIKLELKASSNSADAGISKFTVTTVFMNNMYALPYFKPGKNVIKVTTGEGADLKSNKLKLEYVWEEEGKEKKLNLPIDKVPFEHTVEVAGKELPKVEP